MKLIADSGSTKTDWVCINADNSIQPIKAHTVGLNPFHMSDSEFRDVLVHELLPQLGDAEITDVYFYGSGVRPEVEEHVTDMLREVFPAAHTIEAHSDMLGAARALCGHTSGVACILGTGANSCVFDGYKIVHNTPALGYILGDEGSGAVLGKHLIHDLYTGVLSQRMRMIFEQETRLKLSDIIDKVYRQPQPNRFLASFSEFIHRHLDDDGIREMVYSAFSDFVNLQLSRYGRPELPVSFVGSIAWYYQAQLSLVLQTLGYHVGTILKSPLEGLITYHQDS